jgi:hypothetical protein
MSFLEPGNISLVFQVVILILLILGTPLAKSKKTIRNLTRHGYFTLTALTLHTILIFAVMIPSLLNGLLEFAEFSLMDSLNVWFHSILGAAAEVLAIILVAYWLYKKPQNMSCTKLKQLMLPTFVIWIISVANGILIHVLGIL